MKTAAACFVRSLHVLVLLALPLRVLAGDSMPIDTGHLPAETRFGIAAPSGYEIPLRWLSDATTGSAEPARPITGNWFDRQHGGHGYDFQLFALDDASGQDGYFLTFYTYENDGTPEWYQAVGTMVDGVFTTIPQANGSTLYRVLYTTTPTSIVKLALDNSVSGSVTVDFNQAADSPTCLSMDRSNALQLAVMSWRIGNTSATWCVEPIVGPSLHPNPDLNGHWFAPSDSGWGMEILDVDVTTSATPLIVIYMYYPGPGGQPTWATASGNLNNGSVTMPLLQVSNGFCRTCPPPAQLTGTTIGSVTLTFDQLLTPALVPKTAIKAQTSTSQPTGTATIVANYPGGGGFNRTQIPMQMLSMNFVSTGPLVIYPVNGTGQQGTAFTLPQPDVQGGAKPYHFRFDTFLNGSPPAGSIIDLFTGVVSIPSLNVVGTYTFGICVDDIEGESSCTPSTVTITPSNSSSSVTWIISDQCNNGSQMDYRFFDINNNTVWPSSTTVYVISDDGKNYTSTLSCPAGDQVCYGAQSGSYSWGVGLNDTSGCSSCCGYCGQGPYSAALTCGTSTFYYANWTCGTSSQCAQVLGGYDGSEGPFCSLTDCENWGNQNIPYGYSCSTQHNYAPYPGGSQCYTYP